MNGTGFMVKFDVIKDTGWNTKTLTEDVEFSLLNIAKGNNLGWAVDAIVYDEQPTTFSQSWNQRTRWSKGHVQIFKYYIKDLAKGVAKNKTVASFDGLVYILCIPVFIISVLLMVVNFIMWLMQAMTFGKMITYLLGMLLLGYGVLAFSAIITLLLEKKPIKTMIKGVLTYPFFMATWSIINFVVFFGIKKNVKWDKIEHNKSVSIDEINEQKNAKRSKS
jgi:cellulose synthase/poly-beta-1,6-N-acetylglucosamine synthase-like glycosyltransferase